MPSGGSQLTTMDADFRHQFKLRGLVFCGEAVLIVSSGWWLDAPLSWLILAVIFGFCVAANMVAWHTLRRVRPESVFCGQLWVDLAALAALLYLTGGATNPLVWLLLLPLPIAATVVSRSATWLVTLVACTAYTLLLWFYQPLPGMHLPAGSGFALHVLGMWIGFITSALLIAHFLSRMAECVRARDNALARAREQALRDDKLVSMGALAAGAAHDLGTPLGTLAVLTEELADDVDMQSSYDAHRKLALMAQQIDCC